MASTEVTVRLNVLREAIRSDRKFGELAGLISAVDEVADNRVREYGEAQYATRVQVEELRRFIAGMLAEGIDSERMAKRLLRQFSGRLLMDPAA